MTDTCATSEQLPLAIAQSPSSCILCNTEFSGLQTWRAHVKSDEHVYNLRAKIAQPGSAIQPLHKKQRSPSRSARRSSPNVNPFRSTTSSETEDEPSEVEFNPATCLFCSQVSSTEDDSTTHMATAHGFSVPFQEFLAVDLETILSYLHTLIFSYRECISCHTQRGTIKAVQQHMASKNHCRFEITAETEEFYTIPQSQFQVQARNDVIEEMHCDPTLPVRLPSGKLIAHRKNLDVNPRRAARRELPDGDSLGTAPETTTAYSRLRSKVPRAGIRQNPNPSSTSPPSTPSTDLEVAQRNTNGGGEIVHRSEALLAAQLSKLQVAGNRAQQKEEKRRGRLDRGSNPLLFKHFRLDAGDSRIGRAF
ncbi:C2H2 type zinc-finger-domain-containing protein [Aspergillus karnatakaensis]|uniref:C2H2-type zinc finger protein n=1 Tax=Aspergillus karnatakaensis TaxID=1810916 RepID=UPI003CCD9A75